MAIEISTFKNGFEALELVSPSRPIKNAFVNVYLAVFYSVLPLSISGSQTVIQYIRDQMNRTSFADVATHPPCGQSISSKPGSFSGQATPHSLPMSKTLASIFKTTKNQAK